MKTVKNTSKDNIEINIQSIFASPRNKTDIIVREMKGKAGGADDINIKGIELIIYFTSEPLENKGLATSYRPNSPTSNIIIIF